MMQIALFAPVGRSLTVLGTVLIRFGLMLLRHAGVAWNCCDGRTLSHRRGSVLITTDSHQRRQDAAAVRPRTAPRPVPARALATVPRLTCVMTSVVTIIITTSTIGRITPC